jgi:hypothetical protein
VKFGANPKVSEGERRKMKELRHATLAVVLALLSMIAFPTIGHAAKGGVGPSGVEAPTAVACSQVTDTTQCPPGTHTSPTGVCVTWDAPLSGTEPTKYSADFECTLDTTSVDFDFGTGDASTHLFVSFADMNTAASFVSGGTITDLTDFDCTVRVKGLAPGRNGGRQNNPFSPPIGEDGVDCGTIPAP